MSDSAASRKLRVLMVGQFARRKGENDGGVSAVMSYLSDAMLRRHDIEFFGARIGSTVANDSTDESLGFPVFNVGTRSWGLLTGFRRYGRRLSEILAQVRPDIVHGQGADLSGVLALRSRLPAIVTVHGIIGEDAKFKSRLSERLRETLSSRFIERPLIRRAPSLILISPYVAEYYGSSITGKAFNIPNPVGQEYFDLVPQPQHGRILYAGRIIPRKGLLDLVRAFSKLRGHPASRLIIAGSLTDTQHVAQVRKLIQDLGVENRVEFSGLLHDREVLREFSIAQVLALPSYQETAPMVVLQAMAAGLPVVATGICGVPYQVKDGRSGLLYRPGDVDQLAAHLGALLASPEHAVSMGAAGREIARTSFHADKVAEATVAAYRVALATRIAR